MAIAALALLIATGWAAAGARAAELVMFDAKWCGHCKRFHREVGESYGQSDVAQVFPLRVIDIDHEQPDFEVRERVRSTPTFVFVEDGREIARFSGYASPDRFYDTMRRAVDAYHRAKAKAAKGS